jgi:hypothetical protein
MTFTDDFDPEFYEDEFCDKFPEDFDFDSWRDEKLAEHEDWFRGDR